jgi:hypothetical protein
MSRTSARGALAGIVVALLVLTASAVAGGLSPNPANDPRLVDKPIEGFRYDHAKRCRDRPARGTKALEKWLKGRVRGGTWGIVRCERLGGSDFSLHAEGRAIDWRLDARNAKERRAAMNLIHTMLEPDRNAESAALARRMGVQGLIFNCRSWWSGQDGLGEYSYCYRDNGKKRKGLDPTQAHKDHVHIELNWPGARKRTSFWRSPLA